MRKHAVEIATAMLLLNISPLYAVSDAFNPTLADTLTLRVGAIFLDGETSVRSTPQGVPEFSAVDLSDLGLDSSGTSPYFNLRWRAVDRLQVHFEYFSLSRDGSKTLNKNVNYENITIGSGATANAEVDSDFYAITLGWSFLRDPRYELGAGVGLHVIDSSAKISGQGRLNGVPVALASAEENITAPLPNLRLYGTYAITPQLAIDAGIGLFSTSYGDFDGSFTNFSAAIEWRPMRQFGIGVGYSLFDMNVKYEDGGSHTRFDYSQGGPLVFVTAGF